LSIADGCALVASLVVAAACSTLSLSRWPRVVVAVLLTAGCVYAATVSDASARKMPQFWGHVFPAALLLCAGRQAADSAGLLAVPSLRVGAIFFCIPLAVIVGEILGARSMGMDTWAHVVVFATIAFLIGSATAGAACTSSRHFAARVMAARRLVDPVCLSALAVVLAAHEHDKRAFAVMMHQSFAAALASTGAVQLAASLVHASLPVDAPACVCCRLLHAFCWTVCGLWMMMMAWWCYVAVGGPEYEGSPGCGLAYALQPRSFSELHNTIFAATMLTSAGINAGVHCCAVSHDGATRGADKVVDLSADLGEDALPLVNEAGSQQGTQQ